VGMIAPWRLPTSPGVVLGSDLALEVASLVKGSVSVTSLDLTACSLGREGVTWLCHALVGHPSIQSLAIGRNALVVCWANGPNCS
jgi:hypothetical protein